MVIYKYPRYYNLFIKYINNNDERLSYSNFGSVINFHGPYGIETYTTSDTVVSGIGLNYRVLMSSIL